MAIIFQERFASLGTWLALPKPNKLEKYLASVCQLLWDYLCKYLCADASRSPLRYKYFVEQDGHTFETLAYPPDTSYRLVKTEVINPADKPMITNFTIWDQQGEVTQQLFQGNKRLIIAQCPTKISHTTLHRLHKFIQRPHVAFQPAWIFPCHEPKAKVATSFEHVVYFASANLFKTMIRSNLGFVWLQEGVVVGKWTYKDLAHTRGVLTKLGFMMMREF